MVRLIEGLNCNKDRLCLNLLRENLNSKPLSILLINIISKILIKTRIRVRLFNPSKLNVNFKNANVIAITIIQVNLAQRE